MNEKIIINDCHEILREYKKDLIKLSNKNFLITGGGGFLLSYFCDLIYEFNKNSINKINLYIIDNFFHGKPNRFQKMNKKNRIFFMKRDILKLKKTHIKFNYIIHGASIASPIFYKKFPIETIKSNVLGLVNLLEENINNKNLKSFLFMSTSEVYGSPPNSKIPTREDYNGNVSFTGPRACYDESKRLGETIAINYFKKKKIPIKVVRPFNVYGPGQSLRDGRIIPDLMNSLKKNRNINLFSNGKPTRSFCYISDQIRGILNVIFWGKNGEAYNIGTTDEISINELSRKIIKISKKKLSIKYIKNVDNDYTKDNPQRRCPNISKIKNIKNWKPKIKLDIGIKKTLNYYKI